jgi:hypothetical protein
VNRLKELVEQFCSRVPSMEKPEYHGPCNIWEYYSLYPNGSWWPIGVATPGVYFLATGERRLVPGLLR